MRGLTEGYQVITMRTMKRMVETERKGPSTPAISLAVSGSNGSLAAVSKRACAAAMACCPAPRERHASVKGKENVSGGPDDHLSRLGRTRAGRSA